MMICDDNGIYLDDFHCIFDLLRTLRRSVYETAAAILNNPKTEFLMTGRELPSLP